MSLKFDYLLTILNKLDHGEAVTNRSIMDDLEVSERSAYRYIESLIMAGFPVLYDRRRKSYTFMDGYQLKKLEIAPDEALALALARKVMTPFGTALNDKLETVQKRLSVPALAVPEHIVLPKEAISPHVEGNFQQIYRAITAHRRLQIIYRSPSADSDATRTVEPFFLFFQDGMWYMRANCRLAKDQRTFRLDRINSLMVLDEFFSPQPVSPDLELADAFGANLDGDMTNVVLRFDPDWIPFVSNRTWHPSQADELLSDGRLEMRFSVRGTDGIKHWIYRWLPGVEVVAPAELRETVSEELSQALKQHKDDPHG